LIGFVIGSRNMAARPACWFGTAASWGYLWWNNTDGRWPGVPRDAYAALGRFDNDMLVVPSLSLIVIRQVGDDSANNRKIDIAELWRLASESVTEAKSTAE
jgi:hypothetical protein